MKKIFQLIITLGVTTITTITLISCKKTSQNVTANSSTPKISGPFIGTWLLTKRSGKFENGKYTEGNQVVKGVVATATSGSTAGGDQGGDSSVISIEFKNDKTYTATYIKSANEEWKSAQAATSDSGISFTGTYDVKEGQLFLENAGVFGAAKLDTTTDKKTIKEDGEDEVIWVGEDMTTSGPRAALKEKGDVLATIDSIGKIILLEKGYIKVEATRKTLAKGLKEANAGIGITDDLTNIEEADVSKGDTAYIAVTTTGGSNHKLANIVLGNISGTGINTSSATAIVKEVLTNLEAAALIKKTPKEAWDFITGRLEKAAQETDINKVEEALMIKNNKNKLKYADRVATLLKNDEVKNAVGKILTDLQSAQVSTTDQQAAQAKKDHKPEEAGSLNKFCRYTLQLKFAHQKQDNSRNSEPINQPETYNWKVEGNTLILTATNKNYFTFDTSAKRNDSGVQLTFKKQ